MKTDLNLLRILLAIYETGTVTAAAERMRMSQPAASAALSRLRESLGDELFVRNGARMEATARAQSIIARTRDVIEVIDREILPNPAFEPSRFTGDIVLCMSEIGELVFLPRLRLQLRQQAQQARVVTLGLSPRELEEALHDGTVDAAVGYYPDLTSPAIKQCPLYNHDLTCLVRSGHPIATARMELSDFIEGEHVLVKDGGRNQEMFEQELATRKVERKIVLRTSHYMSVPSVLVDSDLIVVLPRALAEFFVARGGVRTIDPPFEIGRYDLKYYEHRRYTQDPKVQWLRAIIVELFATVPFPVNTRA